MTLDEVLIHLVRFVSLVGCIAVFACLVNVASSGRLFGTRWIPIRPDTPWLMWMQSIGYTHMRHKPLFGGYTVKRLY